MKRNCRFLIALSLFAWMAVGLKAQDRLVVQMKNGAQTQYDLSQLKKLIFSEDQFTVVGQDASMANFKYDDTRRLHFETSTGISPTTEVGKNGWQLLNDGQTLTLKGADALTNASFMLFDPSGRLVMSNKHWTARTIDISRLCAGAYVLKVNNQTFKFLKK